MEFFSSLVICSTPHLSEFTSLAHSLHYSSSTPSLLNSFTPSAKITTSSASSNAGTVLLYTFTPTYLGFSKLFHPFMYDEKSNGKLCTSIVTSKWVTYIRMRISSRIEKLPAYLYVLQTVLSTGHWCTWEAIMPTRTWHAVDPRGRTDAYMYI